MEIKSHGRKQSTRTERTRLSQHQDEEFIDLGQTGESIAPGSVEGYTMKIRKITTTDEAKVQVVLETEGASDESLA